MQPGAVGQAGVHVRMRVVQTKAGGGREPAGQPLHRGLIREPNAGVLPSGPAIHPDVVRSVDDDVGRRRIGQQVGQRSGANQLALQQPDHPEHLGVADQA